MTLVIGSPSLPIADPVRTPDHPSRDAPAPPGASARPLGLTYSFLALPFHNSVGLVFLVSLNFWDMSRTAAPPRDH